MARDSATPAGRGLDGRTALIALVAATVAVFLTLALQPGLVPATASCRHAGARAHQVSLAKVRKAITCLVNHQRSKRDRRRLEPNARLELAADRHTRTMLAKDCLRHRCPGEPGLNKRVRRTGYTDGQEAWRFAENLGYDNTPRQMVRRWLHSNFNRRNMLNPDFRDVGVGVRWGTPNPNLDDSKFATYTLVFGWRRP